MNDREQLTRKIQAFYENYHKYRPRQANQWMRTSYWPAWLGQTLEIGGGTLFPDRKGYTLIDLSIEAARRAHQNAVPALVADGINLPFKDNKFDTLSCYDVLEHVVYPVKFLKEMCRVARRRVVIAGPNYVGQHVGGMSRYLPWRTFEFLSGPGKSCPPLENPYLSFDEQWHPDRDAVAAPNAGWVADQITLNGFRISCLRTWETNYPWFNHVPVIRCLGTFMLVVADKL